MTKYIDRSRTLAQAGKKTQADSIVRGLLFFVTLFSASVIILTIVFIVIQGLKPFIQTYTINGESYRVDFFSFLIGNQWQNGVSGYGAGYIIINTLYITFLTTLLAGPISVLTALVIVRMSDKWVGGILQAVVEMLAAVPSVIYGMFGMGQVTGWTKSLASLFNVQSAGGLGTLTSVLVLTMMSFPTITMLAISAIRAVNKNLIMGSLALGASVPQTNYKVVLVSARSGIFSGIILGVDRALGEATAVSMVCGNAGSGPSFSLFSTTRTLTSTMLTGMSDASGLNYDIRFSAGILLIFIIILVNLFLSLADKRLGKVR